MHTGGATTTAGGEGWRSSKRSFMIEVRLGTRPCIEKGIEEAWRHSSPEGQLSSGAMVMRWRSDAIGASLLVW
jgi:hypothetical protein